MKRFAVVLGIASVLGVSAPARCQRRSQAQLVATLRSVDPLRRADAFSQLIRRGELPDPSSSTVLVELLERENDLLYSTLRASDGQNGISGKYGEDFAEYYGQLFDTCVQRCDRRQSRTIEALANGGYAPSSPFALELAQKYAAQAYPVFVRKTRDRVDGIRLEAVTMLGKIAAAHPALSTEQRSAIHEAVIAAVKDHSVSVRRTAIRALGDIGNKSDAELLRQVIRTDNSDAEIGMPSIRDEARAALSRLPPP